MDWFELPLCSPAEALRRRGFIPRGHSHTEFAGESEVADRLQEPRPQFAVHGYRGCDHPRSDFIFRDPLRRRASARVIVLPGPSEKVSASTQDPAFHSLLFTVFASSQRGGRSGRACGA
jgi:hypothetical protein